MYDLTLTHEQGQALRERIDNLRDGFAAPDPIAPGSIDSFKRGADAALALVSHIVLASTLHPSPSQSESCVVFVTGPHFSEPQFTIRVE